MGDSTYGYQHKKLRKQWALQVATGAVPCARCGELIEADAKWDLGHVDGDRTQYAGPEHRACNRATLTHAKAEADNGYAWFV